MEAFFGFIYDELGEDTLQAWFGEMRLSAIRPFPPISRLLRVPQQNPQNHKR
jgi:hypothetical protein